MEKHRPAEGRGHGAERAHCGQRRLFVGRQHNGQTPSGQSGQRKEDQTAEQAQRNRCLVSTARHGGGRDTGDDHGHGCFQQQEEQAHPVGPLRDKPDDTGGGEAEQRAAAACEQQAHGVDAGQQRRGQAPPDAGGILQEVQCHEQRQREQRRRYVGVVIQAVDTGGGTFLQSAGVIRAQGVHQSVKRPEQHPTAAHVQRDESDDGGNGRGTPQKARNVLSLKAGQQDHRQGESGNKFIELGLGADTEGRIDSRRAVDDGEDQQTQHRHGQPLLKAKQRLFAK